jgi:hypothetical protein
VALFSKFFGRTISEAAAFALGGAIRSPLEPPLVELTNETWQRFVDAGVTVPTDAGDAAEIAAEDVASIAWAKDQASQRGVGGDQMDKLIAATRSAPGLGELYQLWRRSLISTAEFEHGLRKARFEVEWDKPLEGLRDVLLSSEELAMMQQQGFVDDTRANSEGRLQGVTPERQQLRFEASGLPPGIVEGLQMLRRGIIDAPTFAQIVREGHTKTKYTDELLALKDVVLNANDYVTNTIRGWSGPDVMHAGGELTGHTPEQMDLLFQNHGRPLSWHQVFIGLRRGGTLGGDVAGVDDAFLTALRQSDIRPEWYALAWAQRYTYPAAFVLRGLTQSGDVTAAEAEQILLYEGWEPKLAHTVTAKWAQGSSSAAKEATVADLLTLYDGGKATLSDTLAAIEALGYPADEAQAKLDTVDARRVVSAKSAAISDLHAKYKKGELPDANVVAALHGLGVADWAAPMIVAAWREFLQAEAQTPPTALPPTVTSFTPTGGAVGAHVTLHGSNFTGVTAVALGATAASYTVVSTTQIDATVPAGALSAQWVVTAAGGTGASGDAFQVS